MKFFIHDAKEISVTFLQTLGLSEQESRLITENLIDAELAGKKTHGFIRLLTLKKQASRGILNKDPLRLDIVSETPVSLHIDGHYKLGYGILYQILDKAIEKVQASKMVSVGVKHIGTAGYIGAYARKAAERDLLFIGFHNSQTFLVPYGSKKGVWGTNPLTIGIPAYHCPVILDMASSQITHGDVLIAKNERKKLPPRTALNRAGRITRNPTRAVGLLPFAEHKGSGLACVIEIFAGILTGSYMRGFSPSDQGSFFILLDPRLFQNIRTFKNHVAHAIKTLKNSPRMKGFPEIYFPGERSCRLRKNQLSSHTVEISNTVIKHLSVSL